MARKTQQVRVRLHLPPGAKPTGPAHIWLSIDDVSLADRAAIPVETLEIAASENDEILGPYELHPSLQPWKSYTVRAHVDWSGDGNIVAGDLITMAQTGFPHGAPADMDLDVDVSVV